MELGCGNVGYRTVGLLVLFFGTNFPGVLGLGLASS